MFIIKITDEFDNWFGSIRDGNTRMIIVKRIRSMSLGSLGETNPLEGGLFEAKIRYGPGFRLYFVNKDPKTIVILWGGEKSTQKGDIKKAQKMLKEL
jgi:putative addiction module killer protein